MLVELAIGDAYGAGFEFVPRSVIERDNLGRYYRSHQKYQRVPGSYTDDTQMTLAIVEWMLSGEAYDDQDMAQRFVAVFKRDPRRGYASGFYDFLCKCPNGETFLAKIRPKSEQAGAAMRAIPLGLFADLEQVKEVADAQACITHQTQGGRVSAQAAALMAHYCRYQLGPLAKLPDFLTKQLDGDFRTPFFGYVDGTGMACVRAAVTALSQHQSLRALLLACIDVGGDVDTVATMALGAASMSPDYQQDLPQSLYDGLERGQYGYDYLVALDSQLRSHFL